MYRNQNYGRAYRAGAAAAGAAASLAQPHQQAVAAGAPRFAGMDVSILPEHRAALDDTLSNRVKCVPNYRNRIKEYIKWLQNHYPDYAAEVAFELSDDQKANKKMYHTATHDLRYDILNPQFMQLFMSSKKERPDGKHYGFDHVRKYHDAVLYCAKMAEVQLPSDYLFQMNAYKDTMKKEFTIVKGEGKMEEHEADPIPFSLYEDMNMWAIEAGSVSTWAFSALQWNCIGRTVNISPLGFHKDIKYAPTGLFSHMQQQGLLCKFCIGPCFV